MQPDAAAVYLSPKAPIVGPSASTRLRLAMRSGPVCLVPRLLDDAFVACIDGMPPAALPAMDVSGSIERVRQEVEAALAPSDGVLSPAMAWLRQDLIDLSGLFASGIGVKRLRLHLQVVDNDMCRRFHVDNVAYRLVTTYRGPGTEWIAPIDVARASEGTPLPVTATKRLERGTIAIIRGGRNATPDRPGVLHRSPPIKGSGKVRLLLAVSDVDGVVEARA